MKRGAGDLRGPTISGAARTYGALRRASKISAAALAKEKVQSLESLEKGAYEKAHPALRPDERPEYWQWRDMCGHAVLVDGATGEQICCGKCPYAGDDHNMLKTRREGEETVCDLKCYRKMKDVQNMF